MLQKRKRIDECFILDKDNVFFQKKSKLLTSYSIKLYANRFFFLIPALSNCKYLHDKTGTNVHT